SRRRWLAATGSLALAAIVVQACGASSPAAPAATTAPAAPAAAATPTSASAAAPAAAVATPTTAATAASAATPTTAAAAQPAAAGGPLAVNPNVKGKLEIFSWWTNGGEVEALNASYSVYKKYFPNVEIVNAA